MTEISSTQSRSLELARNVDDVVSGDLLVIGSPPPEGRDLDLVARSEQHAQLAVWLASFGFANERDEWVRFRDCTVEAIDLLPSTVFGLDETATGELFRAAHRLPQFRHLVRAAPHHRLLMHARWATEAGVLSEKRRARITRVLEEDPEAWRKAESTAATWRATRALATVRRAYDTGSPLTRIERAAALAESLYAVGRTPTRARARAWLAVMPTRRASGSVVSFSGLDGAGKSTQIEGLQRALELLGFEVAVQWTRLEWTTLWENPWLGVLGWPARKTLALASRMRRRDRAEAGDCGTSVPQLEPSAVRARSNVISQVWVTIVAFAHGQAQRRETRAHLRGGKVVLCDRYTLDTAVHLRFRYGQQRNYNFQIGLVRRLSPRPLAAYLMDVPAATAHARKAEQYSLQDLERQAELYRQEHERLGVRLLDGELPREELCAEIATEVWRVLRGTGR
jgi:thymidylate kinase